MCEAARRRLGTHVTAAQAPPPLRGPSQPAPSSSLLTATPLWPCHAVAGVLEFPADPGNPVKTTGLHRAPLSAGVKNATQRYDLPSPAVAVRNLVGAGAAGCLCGGEGRGPGIAWPARRGEETSWKHGGPCALESHVRGVLAGCRLGDLLQWLERSMTSRGRAVGSYWVLGRCGTAAAALGR